MLDLNQRKLFMNDLDEFRKDKDELFGKREESPLTQEQKSSFKGLNYFTENSNLIFHALKIKPLKAEALVQIKTSAGDTQPFKKLGNVSFEVFGKTVNLTVYSSTDGSGLFLPFRDETNKSETYHDGRYVEVDLDNGVISELDFNYAYNPYCAYNDNFRCPITPEENTLPVVIKAGEKKFE